MVLGQAYGGLTDGDGPRWLSVETSIVPQIGPWSLQAGWREAVAGRETPVARGPVLACGDAFDMTRRKVATETGTARVT